MEFLTPLPGSAAVLAAHAPALPQPDQLCGPFAAHLALHALMPDPPSVVDLAVAAGTRVWPEDVAAWRPRGAALRTDAWPGLPRAADPGHSGTPASGVARAVEHLGDAVVVPAVAPGSDRLLTALVQAGRPVGVVANVQSGALGPDASFDVGHFVVLLAHAPGVVQVGDSYAELGEAGSPPGCRVVSTEALDAALSAPPGRGLLLFARPQDADAVRRMVADAAMTGPLWST